MAGVIGGIPRLPASSSKARINRFNAGVGFKNADMVQISGSIAIEIVTSDHTDITDLPSSPDNGKMVFLYSSDNTRRLCIYYEGNWYEEVLTQMT